MRRRWERRRRLVWIGVLLALVVIVAVLSVVDAGLRVYDHLVSATRERRARRKLTTLRTSSLTPRISRA
jgi:hypothetical protein